MATAALAVLAGTAQVRAQDALVLSGGGSRGLAHAGAIAGLEQKGFRPALVVGTSMGAIMGGLYAAGLSVDSIIAITRQQDWQEMFAMPLVATGPAFSSQRALAQIGLHVDRHRYPEGLIPDARVNQLLALLFFDPGVRAGNDFDSLPRRYRSVATDLRDGTAVVLSRGDLAQAVRASMAVPGIFAPVIVDGVPLVDGGIADYLPVKPARDAGARHIVAVDAIRPPTEAWVGPLANALRSFRLTLNNARQETDPPDVMILPRLDPNLFAAIFVRDPLPLIEAGREAALDDAPAFDGGTAARAPGAQPRQFTGLRIVANDSSLEPLVRGVFGAIAPGPYDPAAVFAAVTRLHASGLFRGLWPTVEQAGDDATLVVQADARPPTLLGAAGGYDSDRGFRAWLDVSQRVAGPNELTVGGSAGAIESRASLSLRHVLPRPDISVRAAGSLEWFDVRQFDVDVVDGEREIRRASAWLGLELDRFEPDVEFVAAFRAERIDTGARDGSSVGPYVRLAANRRNARVVGVAPRLEAEWRFGDFEYRRIAAAGSIDHADGPFLAAVVADVSGASADAPADVLPALGDAHAMPGLRWGRDRDRVRALAGADLAWSTPFEAFVRLRLRAGAVAPDFDALRDVRWLGGAEAGIVLWTPAGQISVDAGVNTRGDWRIGIDIGPLF